MILLAADAPESTVWENLLSVVLYGTGAGVGVAVLFALAIRGLATSAAARREGQGGLRVGAWGAIGVISLVLCIAATVVGVVTMLHR